MDNRNSFDFINLLINQIDNNDVFSLLTLNYEII